MTNKERDQLLLLLLLSIIFVAVNCLAAYYIR